jgi:hypothetical protein
MAELVSKVCYTCGIEKPIDNYYHCKGNNDGHVGNCKECIKKRITSNNEFKDSSERVPLLPGVYRSESQKKLVFEFLQVINWKYDNVLNIWYKPPLKTRYNDWKFPKKKIIPQYYNAKHTHTIREERRKEMGKKPEKYKPRKRLGARGLDQIQQNEIREQYQQKKMTQQKLADKYNVAVSYINCILHYRT